MTLPHLIAFNLALLAALASPGPAFLMLLRATLTGGRLRGVVTGLGLGTMAAVWTTLAVLGLDTVFALFPFAYLAMKAAGALYLLWLAVKMWRQADEPLTPQNRDAGHHRAFFTGFSVNLANPKSALFAASVLIVIFPRDLGLADKAMIVTNQLCVEWIIYGLLATAFSTGPARTGYLRLKPVFDRIASVMLGALGLRLLSER